MPRHSSSTSFQFERAQTDIRMRQSRWRFWTRPILLVWLLSAAVYLYINLTIEGRSYFTTLLSASFWGWLWPSHLVPYQGKFYDPIILATWLQKYVYGNSLSSMLIESLLMGALPAVACIAGAIWYARRRAQEPNEEHIRGVQLSTSQQLQKEIDGPRKWWQSKATEPRGMDIAGISIPYHLETHHFILAGATGSGKSTQFKKILRQIAARGETAIICDPERELTPQFYDPSRGDVILNPTDARCPYWSPWLELAEAGDADTLATSILPDPPERSDTAMYFVTAARELFLVLLQKIASQDPQELSRVLFGPIEKLLKLIENTSAANHVPKDAAEQMHGVLSTLQIALKGFRFLPPQGGTQWSALKWADKRQGWLFMPCRESDRAAALSLQSMWLDNLIHRLLDTPNGRLREQRVWIVIDEVATMRRLQHLVDGLTRLRKYGVSIVLGFQDRAQLHRIYGRETTATLLAAPKTKLLLQTGEPETAKWCSDSIGSREVIYPNESESAGSRDTSDRINVADLRKNEAVVMDSTIMQLKPLRGYIIVAGYGVAEVSFPFVKGEEKEPGFIPRPSSQASYPPPTYDGIPIVEPERKVSGPRMKT